MVRHKTITYCIFFVWLLVNNNYKAQSVAYCTTIGGKQTDVGPSLAISKKGNVYHSGITMSDTASASSCSLALTVTGSNAYICKYDSTGLCLWLKKIETIPGSTLSVGLVQIAVDTLENVYLVGSFSGTIDPDPSGITNVLSSVPGNESQFVAKYDLNGNLAWCFSIKDTMSINGHLYINVCIDKNQDLLIAGMVGSDADFDPFLSVQYLAPNLNLGYTGFLCKYSSGGALIWTHPFLTPGTSNAIGFIETRDITSDNQNNIVITGRILQTVDFEINSPLEYTISCPSGGYFLAKYSPGAANIWAFGIEAGQPFVQGMYGTGVEVDNQDNIYVSGVFRHSLVDFDPSPSTTYTLGTSGNEDSFFAKYDSAGNMIFTNQISGNGDDVCYLTDRDKLGNLYFWASYTSSNFDIDFSSTTNTVATLGAYDQAIVRTDSNGVPNTIIPINTPFYDYYVEVVKQYNGIIYSGGTYNGSGVDLDPTPATLVPAYKGIIDLILTKYWTQNQPNNPVSINEYSTTDTELTFYPNPAINEATIHFVNEIDKIEILNSTGALVKTFTGRDLNRVSLINLLPSIYIIRVYSGTTEVSAKLIKVDTN